jgi:hypothetical protein
MLVDLLSVGHKSLEKGVRSSGLTSQLWSYLRERKKWWLAPVIAVMVLVGALLIFAQGSALAPFIYTIF